MGRRGGAGWGSGGARGGGEVGAIRAWSLGATKVRLTAGVDGIILSDVRMPGRDGFHLVQYAHDQAPDLPVILLTAMADDTDRIIGLEMGADDYVTKPFNPRELLSRIRAVLRRVHSLPPQRNVPTGGKVKFEDRKSVVEGKRVGRGAGLRRGPERQHE